MSFNIKKLLHVIKKSKLVSRIIELSIDEISGRGVCKVRCQLIPSEYRLAIRIIKTEIELLYSYQLYTNIDLIRWDNAPHYPTIETFPHHFHNKIGNIISSKLIGNVENDLKIVLSEIKNYIEENL